MIFYLVASKWRDTWRKKIIIREKEALKINNSIKESRTYFINLCVTHLSLRESISPLKMAWFNNEDRNSGPDYSEILKPRRQPPPSGHHFQSVH